MQTDKDNAPRLIVDLNSILNGALLGGEDPDALTTIVEGKVISVNSARYGVDKFFARFVEVLREFNAAPRNVIGVWDGKNAKAFRQGMLPAYKASTRTGPEYEQLNAAREIVSQMLHDMGAHTVVCDGCEADDTIAYLVQSMRTRKNIVITGDGDLMVLVDHNTHVFRQGKLDENPYGPFPHKYITVYKALVGDTSDKIPGAKGFGDAAFVKLVAAFGIDGLEAMDDILRRGAIKSLEEDVADLPVLKKIIDNEAEVMNSWRAARIYPDRVNTLRRPLQWRAGMVKQWHSLGEDDRVAALKGYYGTCTLVHAGNYEQVMAKLPAAFAASPFVSLDIETHTPEAGLDWLEQTKTKGSGVMVDVLGSELTGMSVSFGSNSQYTLYITVAHKEEPDTRNITSEQCRKLVEMIPADTNIVTWNSQFELVVLANEWGKAWADNGWDGMLPNCWDAMMGASHVDENKRLGLKGRSEEFLGYQQETYDEVVTIDDVKHQMNQLTAKHVFSYGADDAIVTAALHTWQRIIMEMEGSWWAFTELEQKCAYMTARATINGVDISVPLLKQFEKEDQNTIAEAEKVIFAFLVGKGWDGTVCPQYDEVTPAVAKEVVNIVLGPPAGEEEFTTRKRKLEAIAADVRAAYDSVKAGLIASAIEQANVGFLNRQVEKCFDGKPKLNFGSPKQLKAFLYGAIGMKPRQLVKMTDGQRADKEFAQAFYAHKDYIEGRLGRDPTEAEKEVWWSKASTDDGAIEVALKFDELGDTEKEVLSAYIKLKQARTRCSLYYTPYIPLLHWKDGKLHPKYRQNQAVTRRWSSTEPSIQVLGNKGDGLKIRKMFKTKHKDYVYISADASGQELRSAADYSRDPAFLACYIGEKLVDVHTLVAEAASGMLWDRPFTYDEITAMRKGEDEEIAHKADDLRGKAKITNFLSLYQGGADALASQIHVSKEDAQSLIDAQLQAFPVLAEWKMEQGRLAEEQGFVTDRSGGVRHLREAILSPNRWEGNKAIRQAGNFPIQSGGQASMKYSMNQMWDDKLFTGDLRCDFVACIHDEIVVQVHREDALAAAKLLHSAMERMFPGTIVPAVSSIAIGRDMAMTTSIGETIDDEKFVEAVEALFQETP